MDVSASAFTCAFAGYAAADITYKVRARAQVVFVPQAQQLTQGGFFYKSKTHPGMWDTAESAQLLLQNLVASHREALEALSARLDTESDEDVAAMAAASAARTGDDEKGGRRKEEADEGDGEGQPAKEQGPTVAQVGFPRRIYN